MSKGRERQLNFFLSQFCLLLKVLLSPQSIQGDVLTLMLLFNSQNVVLGTNGTGFRLETCTNSRRV